MKGQWIGKAREEMEEKGTVGALHDEMDVKEGETIPRKRLEKASHSDNPTLQKRAQFALNVRGRGRRGKMQRDALR